MAPVKFSRVLYLLQRHPWVQEVWDDRPSGVTIRLLDGRVFDRLTLDSSRSFKSFTEALTAVREAVASSTPRTAAPKFESLLPRLTAEQAELAVTGEMVERALAIWSEDPRWGEVVASGVEVHSRMRRSLIAALQHRVS